MERHIGEFENYLKAERKMAGNSLLAYRRDAEEFCRFAEERNLNELSQVGSTDVVAYLLHLKNEGRSGATLNRKLASIRAYFNYLMLCSVCRENPALNIKAPKIERKEIEYLTVEEVELLLSQPDDSVRGLRDRALLELMYAAGLRVSEVVGAELGDLNLRIGFITCRGEFGKARIVPLGRPSRAALEAYIYDARPKIPGMEKSDTQALFVNYNGGRLTRQGIWKLLKSYAQQAGIRQKLTPQTLRNSFAVHMIQNGADLKSLQELLGHEDLAATQIYLSVAKNRIKDVYDRTHPRA